MKREKLETYLYKEITAFFNTGDSVTGVLIKGNNHEAGYYQCGDSFWFRSSHVKKIQLAERAKE